MLGRTRHKMNTHPLQICQQFVTGIEADCFIFLGGAKPPDPTPTNLLQNLASKWTSLMQIKYSGNCAALHDRDMWNHTSAR